MDVIGDIDRLRERVRAQRGHYAELASPGVVTVQRLAVALDSLEREAA